MAKPSTKTCTKCAQGKPLGAFHTDATHADGRTTVCIECRNAASRARYTRKGPPARHGPLAKPGRDGDKKQARARVNAAVQQGKLPAPSTLHCTDCGHVWAEGERRHEYDHHLGYAAEHQMDVEPVCTKCHALRDCPKAQQTACHKGHAFTEANTFRKANGTRGCRACARQRDRERLRPPGYWKAVNDRRRGRVHQDRPQVSL